MHQLAERLYPICRSITGDGVRETLNILGEYIPLSVSEVSSGTQVFDWEVPLEWNIRDAWVKNSDGEKVIDFKEHNLHVIGYCMPFQGRMSLTELKEHLHTLPDQPDVFPYVTSYFEERWGFCLAHNDLINLQEDTYEIHIDTDLKSGFLTYGELLIPGESEKEILLSTYICHPSMANNELSGPVVATFLARTLLNRKKNHYSYRVLFVPETIGSITYLSLQLEALKKKVVGGYVLTCCGDEGQFTYLQTRKENMNVDRVSQHVLGEKIGDYNLYDFLDRGSDERQYNSPGVDLHIGSITRSMYGCYPQYHTSADDLTFITEKGLRETLDIYQECLKVFDFNQSYRRLTLCEPQLSKRGLYPTLSTRQSYDAVETMMNFLAYCDGEHDLVWIAEKIGRYAGDLIPLIGQLMDHDLIERA